MLAEYDCPRLAHKRIYKQGNPNDDGSGILPGLAAGGKQKRGRLFSHSYPASYPPEKLLNGILVNKLGERFVAEDSYHSRTGKNFCMTNWMARRISSSTTYVLRGRIPRVSSRSTAGKPLPIWKLACYRRKVTRNDGGLQRACRQSPRPVFPTI
ncbi:MAG: hypothetical protein IPK95_13710 [Cellvibrionales bacterium]|nr:hypothetical protein [Cellvibrionales bacterium]